MPAQPPKNVPPSRAARSKSRETLGGHGSSGSPPQDARRPRAALDERPTERTPQSEERAQAVKLVKPGKTTRTVLWIAAASALATVVGIVAFLAARPGPLETIEGSVAVLPAARGEMKPMPAGEVVSADPKAHPS